MAFFPFSGEISTITGLDNFVRQLQWDLGERYNFLATPSLYFRGHCNNNFKLFNQTAMRIDDSEIERFSFVILNKSVTQNIKAVKSMNSIKFVSGNIITGGKFRFPIGLLFEDISSDKLKRTPILKKFKQFEFNKLNVY